MLLFISFIVRKVKEERDPRVSDVYFKNHMMQCLKSVFGEVSIIFCFW